MKKLKLSPSTSRYFHLFVQKKDAWVFSPSLCENIRYRTYWSDIITSRYGAYFTSQAVTRRVARHKKWKTEDRIMPSFQVMQLSHLNDSGSWDTLKSQVRTLILGSQRKETAPARGPWRSLRVHRGRNKGNYTNNWRWDMHSGLCNCTLYQSIKSWPGKWAQHWVWESVPWHLLWALKWKSACSRGGKGKNCSSAEGLCMFNMLTDRTAVCAMHDGEGAVILHCHISL